MPDYKEMYIALFRAVTSAITILQEAQQQAEEVYILKQQSDLSVLDFQEAKKTLLNKK